MTEPSGSPIINDSSNDQLHMKSSGSKSVNKWKIPHYYKRSSSQQNTPISNANKDDLSKEMNNLAPTAMNSVMSPKKILLDSSNGSRSGLTKSKKASKRKNGQMTFVNYTVQDSPSAKDKAIEPSGSPKQTIPIALSQMQDDLTPQKKSSRNRVLKIFGSSRNHSSVSEKSVYFSTPNNSAVDHSVSTQFSPESSPSSQKSSSSKNLYNSILKHGLFNSNSSNNEPTIIEQHMNTTQLIKDENDQYSKEQRVAALSKIPLLSIRGNRSSIITSQRVPISPMKLEPAVARDGFEINDESSRENSPNPLVSNDYYNNDTNHDLQQWPADHNTGSMLSLVNKVPEENDASVAFNKIFTRNRTDTISSQSSFASTTTTGSTYQFTNAMSSVPNFQRNMSVGSTASTPHHGRYSPGRTKSPSRPRSRTFAASSMNRLSKDLGGIATNFNINIVNGSEMSDMNTEVFIDNRNSIKKHKRKQASISDLHKIQTTTSAVNLSVNTSSGLMKSPNLVSGDSISSDFSIFDSIHSSTTSKFISESSIMNNTSIINDKVNEEEDEDEEAGVYGNGDHDFSTLLNDTNELITSFLHQHDDSIDLETSFDYPAIKGVNRDDHYNAMESMIMNNISTIPTEQDNHILLMNSGLKSNENTMTKEQHQENLHFIQSHITTNQHMNQEHFMNIDNVHGNDQFYLDQEEHV